uniref:SUEL-type lectin domain-containing protein n=1 Tax=Romanomermis culicivorax TaxID=13658 RepID=A0A915KHQ1_ROMCU
MCFFLKKDNPDYYCTGDFCPGKLHQQLALFELNVCRDQHFAIKCPNHTKIHIQAAKYHYQSRKCGKIADLDDDQYSFDTPNSSCLFDSSQVSKICHNREECKVDVESLLTLEYQELCPIKNILSVFYFCKPNQKSKLFGFFALSSAAGLVFCAAAVTLYKLTATPPTSARVNNGHSHSDSRHHRTGDSRPDLIPLPRLPPKIIDPLTLNVDDFSTYEPARYATLRKSCSVPVRPCRTSTVR